VKLQEELDLIGDLMKLDVGVLYKHLESKDKDRKRYGWIPTIDGKLLELPNWSTQCRKLL